MNGRLHTLIAVLFVVLATTVLASSARAQAPPSWEAVVEGVDLIARVRVVEPGRAGARVEVQEAFHGTAPDGPFLVVGLNDGTIPPEGILEQELRRDEIVWLFVHRFDPETHGQGIPVWQEEGWQPDEQAWITPTTTSGVVPMRQGQARVRLAFGAYHHLAPPMEVEAWESLLRALIAKVHKNERDEAAIARVRSCLGESPPPPSGPMQESPELRCIAELSLRGDRSGDPRLLDFIDADPTTLGAAAGLGAQSGETRFDDLIRAAAVHPSPEAGAVMLGMAAGGGEARVAAVVASMLAASRRPTDHHNIPVDVLRDEAMRERLISILATTAQASSKKPLLDELRFLNARPLLSAIVALHAIEADSWVPAAVKIIGQAERSRTSAVLEIMSELRPTSAQDALLAFIERSDVDPGLTRMAIEVLGVLGDERAATRIRERLTARLAFTGSWPDDRTDMVAVELGALFELEGAKAADLAWAVARQYLGQPAAIRDPAFLQGWRAEREQLSERALGAMPPGSTVSVRVMTEREKAFMDRGERVVLVDANATGGVSPQLRASLARVTGTTVERVRLCGRNTVGRMQCLRDRKAFWILHDRLLTPMLRVIGAQAGLTLRPQQPPEVHAGYWLAVARTQTWPDELDMEHVFNDLWIYPFSGPVPEAYTPPLLPPDLPPLDPQAPSRSR